MIEFTVGEALDDAEGDVLAVPVYADLAWGPGGQWVTERLGSWVDDYLEQQDFTGQAGKIAVVPGADAMAFGSVAFVGLGDDVDVETVRRAAASLGTALKQHKRVVTTFDEVDLDDAVDAFVFGFMLGQYRYDEYFSEPTPVATEQVAFAGSDDDGVGAEIEHGSIVAGAVAFARDLTNEPAGSQPPAELAAQAEAMAESRGIDVTIYEGDALVEERFGGLLAVASGAANPPRMVVLEYAPDGASQTVALVGKGIVFDSGGLSLKPAASMEAMKTDMSGAAAVFATMRAAADLELPIRVLGITPLTENMPGGKALRPGDVMRARNGKTIEVLNTDAEGRLVLADGLSLAVEMEPDLIVDIATLTGTAKAALGTKIGALWSNDDETAALLVAAARRAGEKLWRMPLEDEYANHIESSIADMKNTGERWGAAISAALLLSEFAGEGPWAHLDIAGPARASKAEHYLSKGGTGFGVRTLVALLEDLTG